MTTILSGDVGGTNTRLAVLEPRDGRRFVKRASRTVSSAGVDHLEDAVEDFLKTVEARPERAAFGVAGPVMANRCTATNLPWEIDGEDLRRRFGFGRVELRNDLEAQALGIAFLTPEDLAVLHAGEPKSGNRALIAAGTGLGQAGLFFDGEIHRPYATEGGHTDFGPHSEIQVELLRYLTRRHGRVSWERVLSGRGLVNLFRFFVEDQNIEATLDDPTGPEISRAADADVCRASTKAMELFVELYGAEAGNLALKTLAVNGVFLGGGIAPKILGRLRTPAFRRAFCAKGRMTDLVSRMPVRVILNGDTALYGAAGTVLDGAPS